jgi:hypothetical protein
MPTSATPKTPIDVAFRADFLRRVFSEPQLFAARRLLAESDTQVESAVQRGRLLVTCRSTSGASFGSATLAGLNASSRRLATNCTCAGAQPCVHIVAGYLLASARARGLTSADLLIELLGSAQVARIVESNTPRAPAALTPEVRRWLDAFPAQPAAASRSPDPATVRAVLEPSELQSPLLDHIKVSVTEAGLSRHLPVSAIAVDHAMEPSIQRACGLLLAAGAGRTKGWGPEATPALAALAAGGWLQVAGEPAPLAPGPRATAQVEWEVDGPRFRLVIRVEPDIRYVVDADPALYVDAGGRIGALAGLSARAWCWLQHAPAVPAETAGSFLAAVGAHPELAQVVPELPGLAVESAPEGAFQARLRLTGQGSTARAILTFAYGPVIVEAAELPPQYRQLIDGKWVVAERDRAREEACVERLREGGMRQEGTAWRFYLEAHFADTNQGQWLRLQRTLFADLAFDEDWLIAVDPDFGFAREIIAQKETAEASRRFNHKRR